MSDLVVTTTFLPEGAESQRKTADGDNLFMHYTVSVALVYSGQTALLLLCTANYSFLTCFNKLSYLAYILHSV